MRIEDITSGNGKSGRFGDQTTPREFKSLGLEGMTKEQMAHYFETGER